MPSEHMVDIGIHSAVAAYALFVIVLWLRLARLVGHPQPRVLTPVLITSAAIFIAALGLAAVSLVREFGTLDDAIRWGPQIRRGVAIALFAASSGTHLWYVRSQTVEGDHHG